MKHGGWLVGALERTDVGSQTIAVYSCIGRQPWVELIRLLELAQPAPAIKLSGLDGPRPPMCGCSASIQNCC